MKHKNEQKRIKLNKNIFSYYLNTFDLNLSTKVDDIEIEIKKFLKVCKHMEILLQERDYKYIAENKNKIEEEFFLYSQNVEILIGNKLHNKLRLTLSDKILNFLNDNDVAIELLLIVLIKKIKYYDSKFEYHNIFREKFSTLNIEQEILLNQMVIINILSKEFGIPIPDIFDIKIDNYLEIENELASTSLIQEYIYSSQETINRIIANKALKGGVDEFKSIKLSTNI